MLSALVTSAGRAVPPARGARSSGTQTGPLVPSALVVSARTRGARSRGTRPGRVRGRGWVLRAAGRACPGGSGRLGSLRRGSFLGRLLIDERTDLLLDRVDLL